VLAHGHQRTLQRYGCRPGRNGRRESHRSPTRNPDSPVKVERQIVDARRGLPDGVAKLEFSDRLPHE